MELGKRAATLSAALGLCVLNGENDRSPNECVTAMLILPSSLKCLQGNYTFWTY